MFIKFIDVFFICLLIFCMVGCGGDTEDRVNTEIGGPPTEYVEWHTISQPERNQRIINRAIKDLNFDVDLSCKEWVREVVKDASNGHVIIPSNIGSGDRWTTDTEHLYGWGAAYHSSTYIMSSHPGSIVQIQWKDNNNIKQGLNIHTAIVLDVSLTHVTFIESNYDGTPEVADDPKNSPEFVKIRRETPEDFHQRVKSFTIYYVL